MIKFYLKAVLRNLSKRPFLNLIKITGLSLALTGILFISLLLKNELSYDSFHENADRIYRISITKPEFLGGKHFARTHDVSYIPDLTEHFAEVENYVRLLPIWGGVMMYEDQYFNFNQAFECDSTFFQLFNAELLIGDINKVLNNPGSMVINETFARKVFGDQNPIGKILEIPAGQFYGKTYKYTIKGVMKDFPQNSHFHPDIIASALDEQYRGWAFTYLLLSEDASPDHLSDQFMKFIADSYGKQPGELKWKVHLQKITDIHLQSHKLREIENNGNITNIYVLLFAAVILLLISMSNYANLNIGMAGFQSKFLYINSILGSSKRINLNYFLFEGMAVVVLTILLSVVFLVPANTVVKNFFQLDLFSGNLIFIIIITLLFSVLCIGFSTIPLVRPLLSNLKNHLNNRISFKYKSKGMSKGLIVIQYAFSIILIVAVIIIDKQTDYALNKGMGVREDNVICLESVHQGIQKRFELFKEELLKYSAIQSVSAMFEPPGGQANDMFPFELDDYETDKSSNTYERIGVFPCDYSFPEVFNLNFLSGSTFSETNDENEGSAEYIINESAMRRLNHTNPREIVGKDFRLVSIVNGVDIPRGRIIGVVEDFHLSTVKKEVEPLVLFKRKDLWLSNFVITHKPGMRKTAINNMKQVWNKLFSEYPFQYQFVGSMYESVYKTELLQAKLLSIFTFIALFISSMGLLGLSLIVTKNRVKEIGIRKVNGARVFEILAMLNIEFIKWIMLAFVLAVPISIYSMNIWLGNFAYKTEMNWWIFALAGTTALMIALLTVSFQSFRAARRNPVEALRYE